MVTPARFEHAAYGLGNRRSIQLSYGANTAFMPNLAAKGNSSEHRDSGLACGVFKRTPRLAFVGTANGHHG